MRVIAETTDSDEENPEKNYVDGASNRNLLCKGIKVMVVMYRLHSQILVHENLGDRRVRVTLSTNL